MAKEPQSGAAGAPEYAGSRDRVIVGGGCRAGSRAGRRGVRDVRGGVSAGSRAEVDIQSQLGYYAIANDNG